MNKAFEIKLYDDDPPIVSMGLDLSTSATGVCIVTTDGQGGVKILHHETIGYKADPKLKTLTKSGKSKTLTRAQLADRLLYISNRIVGLAINFGVNRVAREGYAYGKNSRSVSVLAELGGVVAVDLFRRVELPMIHLTVGQCRKFTVEKGYGDKKRAIKAMKKLGLQFDTDDEYDAYAVEIGRAHV